MRNKFTLALHDVVLDLRKLIHHYEEKDWDNIGEISDAVLASFYRLHKIVIEDAAKKGVSQ